MNSKLVVWAFERQLRAQTAQYSTALNGRKDSARHLDELFHRLTQRIQPALFFEVGAFEATASQRVKAALPACVVTAYEASPVNHGYHAGRIDYAALGINYRHAAVSNVSGTTRLRVDRRGGSAAIAGNAASLLRRVDADDQQVYEVPCVRLDDEGAAGSCALWIDVEGAAGLVLEGADQTLQRTEVLKVEVEDFPIWEGQRVGVDILTLLWERGLVPVACDAEYEGQRNVLAVSERALASPGTNEIIDAHLYDQVHNFNEPHWLRQSKLLRSLARPVRRSLSRSWTR